MISYNIFAWGIFTVGIVGFVLGSVIGYAIGKADGEDDTARFYEDKIRRKARSL